MDDIQFWLYLGFGLIYFITRQMKKRKATQEADSEINQPQPTPYKKPVTFEELLKEFTQEKNEDEKEEILDEYVEEQGHVEIELLPKVEDYSGRRFADDESIKVYQDSIKQAEGADLKFERDGHFKSKLGSRAEETESTFGADILASLQNPDDARKAIILSEILNRKY